MKPIIRVVVSAAPAMIAGDLRYALPTPLGVLMIRPPQGGSPHRHDRSTGAQPVDDTVIYPLGLIYADADLRCAAYQPYESLKVISVQQLTLRIPPAVSAGVPSA